MLMMYLGLSMSNALCTVKVNLKNSVVRSGFGSEVKLIKFHGFRRKDNYLKPESDREFIDLLDDKLVIVHDNSFAGLGSLL